MLKLHNLGIIIYEETCYYWCPEFLYKRIDSEMSLLYSYSSLFFKKFPFSGLIPLSLSLPLWNVISVYIETIITLTLYYQNAQYSIWLWKLYYCLCVYYWSIRFFQRTPHLLSLAVHLNYIIITPYNQRKGKWVKGILREEDEWVKGIRPTLF